MIPKPGGSGYGVKGLFLGGCQNCGPFLGTLNIRFRIIIGIQKGTIILTTTHLTLPEARWRSNLAQRVNSGAGRRRGPCLPVEMNLEV